MEKLVSDLGLTSGQQFTAILYKGNNAEIARVILSYLQAAWGKAEPININNLGFVKVLEAQTSEEGFEYTIKLRGEVV